MQARSAASVRTARMNVHAWAALDEDTPGELVDGRIEEDEVPDAIHEIVVTWLTAMFRSWLGTAGAVLGSELKLRITERRGRKADLSVYFTRLPAAHGLVTTSPDVVVEVVSPTPRDGRRDRVEKVDDYAQLGARFYWLVDPALRTLEVLELGDDGRYVRAAHGSAGVLEGPGCEGLSVDLDALWAEADRLLEAAVVPARLPRGMESDDRPTQMAHVEKWWPLWTKERWTQKRIAEHVGFREGYVGNLLRIRNDPDVWKRFADRAYDAVPQARFLAVIPRRGADRKALLAEIDCTRGSKPKKRHPRR